MPDQEAVDHVRSSSRNEALHALAKLERSLRDDDGEGGIDAIVLGVLSQQVTQTMRSYRTMVNIGEEPQVSEWLADVEQDRRWGIGRRHRLF